GGCALELSTMRVAMEHERDGIPVDRLFQPARSQKRVDFQRLAVDGLLHRRVVQQRDELLRAQSRKRRLELQRLIDRLVHEVLDDRLTPWPERAFAKAAAEPLDAGDADAKHFTRVAVE